VRQNDSARASGSSTTELPSDVISRGGRRMMVAALVMAWGYALMLALYLTVWADSANRLAQIASAIALVVSLSVAGYLRKRDRPKRLVVSVGIAYQLFVCSTMWLTDYITVDPVGLPGLAPWACVAIVIFPSLVPAGPKRTLVTALASASLGFPAFAVAQMLRLVPISDLQVVAGFGVSAYVTALIATVPAKIVYRLSKELRNARQLGSYQLLEKLGEGGMGVVYRARHAMLRRPTAVKLLRAGMVGSAGLARFEREVQITAQLTHPNTIRVFDFGRTPEGVFYYAMEYLDGLTLDDVIELDGPQRPERVVHILEQVAGALSEAHRSQLIHRDIKPSNIMLVEQGARPDVAKVLDFGLVRDNTSADVSLTNAESLTGTPQYISPEAIRSPEDVGPASDIYAVGCVAYYLLTGRQVFPYSTLVEVCAAHLNEEPVPPNAHVEVGIPVPLEALVMQCLSKSAAHRPADGRALEVALKALQPESRWSEDDAESWWAAHAESAGAVKARALPEISGRTLDVARAAVLSDRG